MSNIRIELNSEGIKELLRSSDMQTVCEQNANDIMKRYGSKARMETYVAPTRVVSEVSAPMSEASKDNKLLKAVR